MANMNIRTPRFYVDWISHLLARGVPQNGNFDVMTGSGKINFQTGSEAELFDMKPLNKVDFNTKENTSDHVLINVDINSTYPKQSFVAILNHNMNSADAKVRIKASDTESHIQAVDMASATAMSNPAEAVNADSIASSIVTPATDGSTIVIFDETDLRYWGIQFEGNTSGTFDGSTDLFVGCILVGEYYDMPHAPDLSVKRSIMMLNPSIQESVGGQRYSVMASHGRQSHSTTKSPFSLASQNYLAYGGRLAYDMNFSYLNSSDIIPSDYANHQYASDTVINDIWNKTDGAHIPFILSTDKTSTREDDHIFARFAQDSLEMSQVAPDVFNVSMKIEEEF